ncbi:MAG: hypothetical protein K2Y39_05370 [Candidatus Obscuribacterales bacterium]|nr:hypothetical protein [Candidatus Obscuribacterales bacterium]
MAGLNHPLFMKNSWAISIKVWRTNAACHGLNALLAAMIAELNAPVKCTKKFSVLELSAVALRPQVI